MTHPTWSSRSSRLELYSKVISQCVHIPLSQSGSIAQVTDWCKQQFGDARSGNIIVESKLGRLRQQDGDWQIMYGPLGLMEWVAWLAHDHHRVEFILAWC